MILKERENPTSLGHEAIKAATLYFSQRKAVASCLLFIHCHKWRHLPRPHINCSVIFAVVYQIFHWDAQWCSILQRWVIKRVKKGKTWSVCYHLCTLAAMWESVKQDVADCYTKTENHAAIYGAGCGHYLLATASRKLRNFKVKLMTWYTCTGNVCEGIYVIKLFLATNLQNIILLIQFVLTTLIDKSVNRTKKDPILFFSFGSNTHDSASFLSLFLHKVTR